MSQSLCQVWLHRVFSTKNRQPFLRQDPFRDEGGSSIFAWQSGYGVFSVSHLKRKAVDKYIREQMQHHATASFQEEFRLMCERHGIEIDEHYVWD